MDKYTVNMQPIPKHLHTRIKLFAVRNNLKVSDARDMLIDCVLDDNGEIKNNFVGYLKEALDNPY